jgi:hypothetical protein
LVFPELEIARDRETLRNRMPESNRRITRYRIKDERLGELTGFFIAKLLNGRIGMGVRNGEVNHG